MRVRVGGGGSVCVCVRAHAFPRNYNPDRQTDRFQSNTTQLQSNVNYYCVCVTQNKYM